MNSFGTLLTKPWDEIKSLFGVNASATDTDPVRSPDTTVNSIDTARNLGTRLSKMGTFMAIMGGINSAIGTYYAAKSAQYQMKSEASSYQFQSDMAAINARSAEYNAQSILESGKSQVAQYTMEAGQRKAGAQASMAGRGIVLGEGSARDVEASMDIVKGLDVLTINSNAVRAAEQERTQATNYKNQALIYNTSARNARLSAGSISPFASSFTSLLNTASGVASQWQWQRSVDKMVYGGLN